MPLFVGCIGVRNVEPGWLNEYTTAEEAAAAQNAPVQESCDESQVNTTDGFRVAGSVFDMLTEDVPEDPESLCAYALDPLPVLSGGEPIVMAAAEVCFDGSYVISQLSNPPTIGMFVSIDDCESGEDLVMTSATGIDYDDVQPLGDGDILDNVRAYLVTMEYGEAINSDLVDYEHDAIEKGFMMGFVTDTDDVPVSGAQVDCGGCASFYYMDADETDGLFVTGANRNAATSADAGSIFVAPNAQIATYTADDGGSHIWENQLFGSLPGYASFLLFNAQ
jgi:hypothetical protein